MMTMTKANGGARGARACARARVHLAAALVVAWGCRASSSRPPATATGAETTTTTVSVAEAYEELETELRATYAYLERGDFDVEAHLARTRAAAVAAKDLAELRRLLHRSLFAFTDPHVILGPLEDGDPNVWPTSGDIAIAAEADRFVVADVRAGSAADAAGIRPGWVLERVDGERVETRIAELWAGLLPNPTAAQRGYAATLVANGRRSGARALVFGHAGGESRVELANPRELAAAVAELPPLDLQIQGDVAVIRFNNSLGRMETIAAFDDALARCLGLHAVIIDLRNTPSGGNTDVARAVIGHFVGQAEPYQLHEIPAVERSTTVPRRFVEYALPRAPRFEGRLAVLGGRWTGSMGEGMVIGLDAAAGAHTITSDMGDLRGALYNLELPRSEFTLELGVEALFHVDGTPRADYRGDLFLPSIDRDDAGQDPGMRAAMEWIAAGRGERESR
jgi:hypothetical protein